MSTVEQRNQYANELFNLETRLQIISNAIKIAKEEGTPASKLKKMQQDKNKSQKAVDAKRKQLLKAMILACNIQPTATKNWQYVRFATPDHNSDLMLVCASEIDALSVDNRTQPPITISDIYAQIPYIEDKKALKEHNSKILQGALIMLQEHGIEIPSMAMGIECETVFEPVKESAPLMESQEVDIEAMRDEIVKAIEESYAGKPAKKDLVVSYHACMRWIERVIGITDDTKMENYYRANVDELRKTIKSKFKSPSTELLWVDRDDIKYYLGEDNMIFILGREHGDDTVITLYEVDFGFAKHINTMIIKEQAQVLTDLVKDLEFIETTSQAEISSIKGELGCVLDEISSLKARVKYLEAEEKRLNSALESSKSFVTMKQAKFNEEHNKLFKKWKSIK